jgi:hypothetical protein
MKRYTILNLLAMLTLTACGSDKDASLIMGELAYDVGSVTGHKVNIDPELKPYAVVNHISLTFGKVSNEDTYGECQYDMSKGSKRIVINKVLWLETTECVRRVIIKHETEHCEAQKAHTKRGLMSPYLDTYEMCGE